MKLNARDKQVLAVLSFYVLILALGFTALVTIVSRTIRKLISRAK